MTIKNSILPQNIEEEYKKITEQIYILEQELNLVDKLIQKTNEQHKHHCIKNHIINFFGNNSETKRTIKQMCLNTILLIMEAEIIKQFTFLSIIPKIPWIPLIGWMIIAGSSMLIVNKIFNHFKVIFNHKKYIITNLHKDKITSLSLLEQLKSEAKKIQLSDEYQQIIQAKHNNKIISKQPIQPVNHDYDQNNPKTYNKK